jgi:hypothetical protein
MPNADVAALVCAAHMARASRWRLRPELRNPNDASDQQNGFDPAVVRLIISTFGALSCLLMYRVLRKHNFAPPAKRFFVTLALSIPLSLLLADASEFLWLFAPTITRHHTVSSLPT